MEIKAEFEKLKVTPQRRNSVDLSKARQRPNWLCPFAMKFWTKIDKSYMLANIPQECKEFQILVSPGEETAPSKMT